MKNKNKVIIWSSVLVLIITSVILLLILRNKPNLAPVDNSPYLDASGHLIVITSLFPVYDFAKIVGGDKATVSLILPAGSEAHAYRPSDTDKEKIKTSAIFFYTSSIMEPWAPALASAVTSKTKILAVAENLNDENLDPHVWLDFTKASLMVDNIVAEYKLVDPKNAAYYQQNADNYKQELSKLDSDFEAGLKNCKLHEFISGGHDTFGYLAKRYNLKYQAAQGFVPDDSLDVKKVLRLSRELEDSKQPYVYYEESIMPYIAELMYQESGSKKMPLNAAHNIGKFDIESGITFISLMRNDLDTLKIGLSCK